MQSLAQIFSALQRELSSGLPQHLSLPGGIQLQADRVIVALQFATGEAQNGHLGFLWALPEAGSNGTVVRSLHTLTVEFKAPQSTDGKPGALQQSVVSTAAARRPSAASSDQIKDALALIFGPPGFDSSARATVFREAFAELSPEQVQVVIESISGSPPENDDSARRARGLILKLLKSAPLDDLQQGKMILADVLIQNPLDSVLSLIAREWKTQEDWL